MTEPVKPDRPCTCHPDDNPPVPCPKKYALTECRAAAMKPAQDGTPALKCSLYVNGVRVKDQKTTALMFKTACLASSQTARLLRERASQSVNAADGELMRKAAEELEKAQIKPAQDGTPPMWMIFFEDHQLRPELFTDEPAARHRFKQCLLNWSCHLFVEAQAQDKRIEELERELSIAKLALTDEGYELDLIPLAAKCAVAEFRAEQAERELATLRLLKDMDAIEVSALATFIRAGDIPETIERVRLALVKRMLTAERELALERAKSLPLTRDDTILELEQAVRHEHQRTAALRDELSTIYDLYSEEVVAHGETEDRAEQAERALAEEKAQMKDAISEGAGDAVVFDIMVSQRDEARKYVQHTEYWRNRHTDMAAACAKQTRRAEQAERALAEESERVESLHKIGYALQERVEQLQAALQELVRLKDLSDNCVRRFRDGRYTAAIEEWNRCSPLAWETARALSGHAHAQTATEPKE